MGVEVGKTDRIDILPNAVFLPERPSVEEIREYLRDSIFRMHRIVGVSPRGRLLEEARSGSQRARVQLDSIFSDVAGIFRGIEDAYKKIPQGHHLRIELAPLAYYSLGGESFPFVFVDPAKYTTRYQLEVGQRMRYNGSKGSVLEMHAVTDPINKTDLPYFYFQEASRTTRGNHHSSKFLHPRDIYNMGVVNDIHFLHSQAQRTS